MTPRVLNKHHDDIPPDAVYVGRPTSWGNPFKLPNFYRTQSKETKMALRKSVISQYRTYLDENPNLKEQARLLLKGKDLICWCAPLPCHADVLLEIANED